MNLYDLSASQALSGLKSGQFSALEYVKELLRRVDKYAALNAFCHLDEELILREAKSSDDIRRSTGNSALLCGLPIAIKDNINVAHQPTSAGTPGLRNNWPTSDAPVVSAIRRAGAIPFGRTNMHELAYGLTSNNAAFGPVRNPFNPDMVAGGSSGGSAAAVGARIVPAALGTDTGGSVRVPAALCSIFGFRPSNGRYNGEGIVPIAHSRDTAGPMARSVADIVLLDQVLSGQRHNLSANSFKGKRIGVPRGYFFDILDAEVARLVELALVEMSDLGAVLVEADISGVKGCNPRIGRPIATGEVVRDLPEYLGKYAVNITIEDVLKQVASPDVQAIIKQQFAPENRAKIDKEYQFAINHSKPELARNYQQYFDDNQLDFIAFPTSLIPAPAVGDDETIDLAGTRAPTEATLVHNSGPSTIIGLPGLSVPVGLTSSGLPVGMELEARAGDDAQLLEIGLTWEKFCQRDIACPPPPEVS
ncbi:Aspartyl-tRNA(Asn) amidotransferase subunit A @ Glutamyl-tRNA(Gln) amidotransferase subunit A [hydrothermal vent metagenome]|uniref:Aspartyl-tRNA(Asn) amidotransferase subunit A @ Glutamyl-tRNA(Gln) amidotransferase subunit A n=1 Tax=hydrothermal vent metagenome TaxID=652676 RepID=A0A3B0TZS6_9ZZZZ